jgi:oligosaccharide repeat unit polymerase
MVLPILAVIVMGILAAAAKGMTRDWLHPAPMFAVVWMCSCGLPILMAPEIVTSSSGSLWILLNVAIVLAGAVSGTALADSGPHRVSSMTAARRPSEPLSNHVLRILASVCFLLGGLYVFLWVRMQGFAVSQIGDAEDVSKIASRMSLGRYSALGQTTTLFIQLLLSLTYLGPLLGGTLFVRRRSARDTALAVSSMVPCLASFALQSTRSSILYGATMWAAGYVTTRVYCGSKCRRASARALGTCALAVCAIIILMATGDALREGLLPTAAGLRGGLLTDRVKTYFCGSVPAFAIWFDDIKLSDTHAALGRYSLAGAYELIHPGTRQSGVISETVTLATGPTNVYTLFRYIIEDATMPGSLAVMLVLSFCSGFAYCRVREHKERWIAVLAACYAGIVFAIGSIFNYNSILLALVLYGAAWYLPRRREEIRVLVTQGATARRRSM